MKSFVHALAPERFLFFFFFFFFLVSYLVLYSLHRLLSVRMLYVLFTRCTAPLTLKDGEPGTEYSVPTIQHFKGKS